MEQIRNSKELQARSKWLQEVWLPLIEAKRDYLMGNKRSELAKIDEAAREEAIQARKEEQLQNKQKFHSSEEVAARRVKAQTRYRATKRNTKSCFRCVPKHSVIVEEGTTVPEAREVDTEKGLDFGDDRVFSSALWEKLSG